VDFQEKKTRLSITVVVPTYKRPDFLKNCLVSLRNQERLPDEICVVIREDDLDSIRMFRQIQNERTQKETLKIFCQLIRQPGFLPPIQAGIEVSHGDIVAFIDDDAEAMPNWLASLESHYVNPAVGGVGGRVVNMWKGDEIKYKLADVFGKFFWYGRLVGNLYRGMAYEKPVEVDFLMGGNMSYRRNVLEKISVDMRLNNAVASDYEVDLGMQVKALGFRIIFEPQAKVKHHSAACLDDFTRPITKDKVYWDNFNKGYIAMKHSKGWRKGVIITYEFLVGQSSRWGLMSLLWFMIRYRKPPVFLLVAITGRWSGIRAGLLNG